MLARRIHWILIRHMVRANGWPSICVRYMHGNMVSKLKLHGVLLSWDHIYRSTFTSPSETSFAMDSEVARLKSRAMVAPIALICMRQNLRSGYGRFCFRETLVALTMSVRKRNSRLQMSHR